MKKLFYITTFSFLLICFNCQGQWSLETSFNLEIRDALEFNGQLHIAGGFVKRESNSCYWSCFLDGQNFTNQSQLISGTAINKLAIFQDELYCTSGLTFGSNIGLAKWNGSTWVNENNFNENLFGFYVDSDEMYVGSWSGKIRMKKGNSNFVSLPSLDNDSDQVSEITKYNNEIIIAGKLNTFNSKNLNNIARWDGTSWQPLGGGLSGEVLCMVVYKSELYVGGRFKEAGGNEANYIAKWDGNSWSDVGGSATVFGFNGIHDFAVHENFLFVAGDFSEIGGINSKFVAAWNGKEWHELGLDIETVYANSISIYEDKIYVGTFEFGNCQLYSRDLPTNSNDYIFKSETIFSLYPNPVNNSLHLVHDELLSDVNYKILNMNGEIVSSGCCLKNIGFIDCSGLKAGVYSFLLVSPNTSSSIKSKKFVKF